MPDSSVHLRPIRPEELDRLLAERDDSVPPGREHDARKRLEERIGHAGRLVDGRLDLGVEAGGRLVGHVEARHPKQAIPPGVFGGKGPQSLFTAAYQCDLRSFSQKELSSRPADAARCARHYDSFLQRCVACVCVCAIVDSRMPRPSTAAM